MTNRSGGEVPKGYEITDGAVPVSADSVTRQPLIIPGQAIRAFNVLIKDNFNGRQSRIDSPRAVQLMLMEGVPADFANRDDLETVLKQVYGAAGWIVELDKDDWNDQKRPNAYIFTPKTKQVDKS